MGNSINNIKFLGRKFFGVRNLNTTPVYDTDAQAYFNANTTITSAADKNAINIFYLGLKSDGIYTKIKAMYLPIWGSAAACKWNLVNPVDTNAAYRLTFSTGWTYSSSGITPTNAYASTFLSPFSSLTANNIHLSYYSRTNVGATSSTEIGCASSGGSIQHSLSLYTTFGTQKLFCAGNAGAYAVGIANSDTLGLCVGSRTSATSAKLYMDGSLLKTNTTSYTGGYANVGITLAANNINGSISEYSTKQCSFSSIGDGLTDTEVTNFYNRVQTLMTYFGINV